jgi:hypothetical protein
MWICDRLTKALGVLSERLKFEELIYIESPLDVLAEVRKIISLMFPDFDFSQVEKVFNDILKLFSGNYPGYRHCNTLYHDLTHTTDCLLVMARLLHGAWIKGIAFEPKDVNLGLISALMHDTGYIQTEDDDTGTGAKYTLSHIDRSIEFMRKYFKNHGYSREDFSACFNFLKCTGLDVKIAKIKFPSREHEIIGKILGAADLIGQMSDRNYLEKLPLLYHEFAEGGVPGFKDEMDLCEKTPFFWEVVKKRFAVELGQVDAYLHDHFRVRWGIDQDLYRLAIERNMECLHSVLGDHVADCGDYSPEHEDICWA